MLARNTSRQLVIVPRDALKRNLNSARSADSPDHLARACPRHFGAFRVITDSIKALVPEPSSGRAVAEKQATLFSPTTYSAQMAVMTRALNACFELAACHTKNNASNRLIMEHSIMAGV
jgi:hypothetical protein